jgi:hypothetical protein
MVRPSGGGDGVKRDEGGAIAMLALKCGMVYGVLADGTGDGTGVGSPLECVVNLWQRSMRLLSSGILIRFCGSHSNIRLRIPSSSEDRGKIVLRNLESFK